MSGKRSALLIANSAFNDLGLQQLIAPPNDVFELGRVLQIPFIGNFKVKSLENKPSYEIIEEVEFFFRESKPDDLLLLYISGHGIKDSDGRLFFATKNTKRNLLQSTAISANLINEIMHRSRSKQQVLILDCCYSGAFARGMVAKADKTIGVNESFDGRGRVILTASNSMQYAFECDGNTVNGNGVRSIFTEKILQGLEFGKADVNGDGRITIDELYDYVYDEITSENSTQKPEKWDLGVQGNIVIAWNPIPVEKALPVELLLALENPLSGVREGALRELLQLLKGNDKGLIYSARKVLQDLINDDSRKVSTLAVEMLATYFQAENKETVSGVSPLKVKTNIGNENTVIKLSELTNQTLEQSSEYPKKEELLITTSENKQSKKIERDKKNKGKVKTSLDTAFNPWYWITALFGITSFLVTILNENFAQLFLLIGIPVITLTLAYHRPIPWGWAALVVGILDIIIYLGLRVSGEVSFEDLTEDLTISLIVFMVNALIVSVLSNFRSHQASKHGT